MPLFRAELHTTPGRVVLGFVAAVLVATAVTAPTHLLVAQLFETVTASGGTGLRRAGRAMIGAAVFSAPGWLIGAVLFGFPLLMILHAYRVFGALTVPLAYAALCAATALLFMLVAGGDMAETAGLMLPPAVCGGAAAGAVLRWILPRRDAPPAAPSSGPSAAA